MPDAIASRLLARASELDALRSDDVTVADLRAAAAEAGISGSAFDAALEELRQSGRLPTSNPLPRRRNGARAFVVLLTGAVVLAAGLLVARLPSPSRDAPETSAGESLNEVSAVAAATRAVIRSADGAPPVTMAVGREGQLFSALGVAQGPNGRRVGRIEMSGAVGSATTPAALDVSDAAGEVMFTVPVDGAEVELIVPGTAQLARGHAVRLVRDRVGAPLRAEVVTP
ncbi:MAG TPA: hypothetical protein VFN38_15450 [Gemmatimonadaceae bacterium]|nr:hypothetical protein [Gemmatimonadaceae bacterium]